MKTSLIITIIVILALVVGGLFWLNRRDTTPDSTQPAGSIPNLTLSDYAGNPVSLTDFAGKPLVLNSWAAWCPFCVKELPDFAAVQEEFGTVTIIAIDRAENKETAKGFTDQLGVSDKLLFLLDPNDSFYQQIGGFSMPETLFIDSSGNIVEHKRGPLTREEIRERVEQLTQ